jgi:hypothetical protein
MELARTALRLMAPVVRDVREELRCGVDPTPGAGVEAVRWSYSHGPRGTCSLGCPVHGRCHCGCGARTSIARTTVAPRAMRANEPFVFKAGHHLRVQHPRAGAFSRDGVDVERVRPLIFWLRDRHGTMRDVADALGIAESTLRGYAYKQGLKRIPSSRARAIAVAVARFRRRPEWQALD